MTLKFTIATLLLTCASLWADPKEPQKDPQSTPLPVTRNTFMVFGNTYITKLETKTSILASINQAVNDADIDFVIMVGELTMGGKKGSGRRGQGRRGQVINFVIIVFLKRFIARSPLAIRRTISFASWIREEAYTSANPSTISFWETPFRQVVRSSRRPDQSHEERALWIRKSTRFITGPLLHLLHSQISETLH